MKKYIISKLFTEEVLSIVSAENCKQAIEKYCKGTNVTYSCLEELTTKKHEFYIGADCCYCKEFVGIEIN